MSNYDDSDDLDLTPPPVGAQYHPPETEDVLLTLRDLVENARDVPLSASAMISKDEVLGLIDEALAQLPEDLRAARWLLKEREEFLARTRHEADDIVEQARTRAERMVQRTEVVKAAEQRAYEIVDDAQVDARRLRHEVEDFCDQKLASFEIVLERTQRLVGAGRAKLQGTNLLAEAAAAAEFGVAGAPPDDASAASVRSSWGEATDDFSTLPTPPSAYDELAHLDDGPPRTDDDAATIADGGWDEGSLPFEDEPEGRPRLTVVDDRYADLPAPPSGPPAVTDSESTFFDQDT